MSTENGDEWTTQDHVSEAVSRLLPEAQTRIGGGTLAEALHAALWPLVVAAAAEHAGRDVPVAEIAPRTGDKRTKTWQYMVRFWAATDGAEPELVGELDEPAVMTSTGRIPHILADLGADMHGQAPDALCIENVRPLLQQFRNNLGRGNNATLRIPYEADGIDYLCQMDVHRLGA